MIVLPRRIGIMSEAQITLDDVVASVLANNRDIESSRIDRLEASLRLTGAKGVYDPRFTMEPAFLHSESAVSSSLGGGAISGQTAANQLVGDSRHYRQHSEQRRHLYRKLFLGAQFHRQYVCDAEPPIPDHADVFGGAAFVSQPAV